MTDTSHGQGMLLWLLSCMPLLLERAVGTDRSLQVTMQMHMFARWLMLPLPVAHSLPVAFCICRALIMPTLQCYCYNGLGFESVERCRAVGDTSAPLPFNCTLDQVRLLHD